MLASFIPASARIRRVLGFSALLLIAACGKKVSDTASALPAASVGAAADVAAIAEPAPALQAAACEAEAGISYVCGLVNAEDILRLGTSDWLLVSGMNGDLANNPDIDGKLHLVNRVDRSWEVLFPGSSPIMEHDAALYPACPGPLDVTAFSGHGLALQNYPAGSDQYRLYITSHGAREAIETFMIDASAKPVIKWTGCIPMPATSWTNSLVILDDGGFMATQFMDPTGSGMEGVRAGEVTGHVFEWHPGGAVTVITGTELSGANGIAISEDARSLYVASFGSQAIARFDLTTTPPSKTLIEVGVVPDNVRWSSDGTLYTAGGDVTEGCEDVECGGGWSVWEIDPATLQASRFVGMSAGSAMDVVSTALLVDDEIWVGTYQGDRIGIMPKP
jgi:hypothetical protein